jgi:hypothetical protein
VVENPVDENPVDENPVDENLLDFHPLGDDWREPSPAGRTDQDVWLLFKQASSAAVHVR